MTARLSALLLCMAGGALVALSLVRPTETTRRGPRTSHLNRLLRDAGLSWSPTILGAVSVAAALAGAALAEAVTRLSMAAFIAGVAAAGVPVAAVRSRAAARRRAVLDAWPDAIDALLAAVRSGDSLTAALVTAATSGPEPLRASLGAAASRSLATGDFAGAVRALAESLDERVSRQVCAVLALAHDVGGRDLTTVLRDLSEFLRDERALRQDLVARQSWIKNAARVAAAGPWVVLVLLCLEADMRGAFAGAAGTTVLLAGAAATVVGYRLMLVLGRLPEIGAAA